MKAILEFNLPDDQYDFRIASKASALAVMIYDIDNWLRNKLKYGHTFTGADEALEAVRKELWDIADGRGVMSDDIYGE